jgi:hypothetical protein
MYIVFMTNSGLKGSISSISCVGLNASLQRVIHAALAPAVELIFYDRLSDLIRDWDEVSDHCPLVIALMDSHSQSDLLTLIHSSYWQKILRRRFWVISDLDDLTMIRYLFEKGIDDYFSLPLRTQELTIKAERLLNFLHNPSRSLTLAEAKSLGIDLNHFTSREKYFLGAFFSCRDRSLGRSELIRLVWGEGTALHPKTLNVHLHNLRRKLKPFGYQVVSITKGKWSILRSGKPHNESNKRHNADAQASLV